VADDDVILMPRLGSHLHMWGSGHSCHSDTAHDVCVCDCGVPSSVASLEASDG
jgi:hypothetical protein